MKLFEGKEELVIEKYLVVMVSMFFLCREFHREINSEK